MNESSKPKVEVEYKGEIKSFYPEEISSMVLTKMKEISEAYLGKVEDKDKWLLLSETVLAGSTFKTQASKNVSVTSLCLRDMREKFL